MSTPVNVPTEIKQKFQESNKYFPTPLQEFQYFDKYSRFDWNQMRRETWIETVDRAVNYLKELSESKLSNKDYERIRKGILEMRATPSMRLLAMAGDAARRNNICIYNCSYLPVDSPQAWVEALIISMCGCGVGYSVESEYVDKLPEVKVRLSEQLPTVHVVADSMEGWAEALRDGLECWFSGRDIKFDYSKLRPAGTPLKTKGGHSSGPKILWETLDFIRDRLLSKQGLKLTTVDAHDIMTKVGDASISGGVRRTAMIALFDFDDELMLHCKDGEFEKDNIQRYNANNSAVWPDRKLTKEEVSLFIKTMDASQRGEPGIFSRRAANMMRPVRRKEAHFGTNPCGEITLRPFEFCNLTIAIARGDDTYETLKEKVELATIIGTIQSMGTKFPGLRDEWRKNCEEERLLGVDVTGQMDCPLVQDEAVLDNLRRHAYDTNVKYAQILGIPVSTSITCNKPSGNSSQLFNCSSGIHPRWSQYYTRNVRVNAHSPVRKVLEDCGVTLIPDRGRTYEEADIFVVGFPVKSLDDAKTRNDMDVRTQFFNWLKNKIHWTEHNPSCTITYKPDEIETLIDLLFEYQNFVGGLSFLPHSDANYPLMPYQDITKEEYEEAYKNFPEIDWSRLYHYEKTDMTEAAQLLACVSGQCDI